MVWLAIYRRLLLGSRYDEDLSMVLGEFARTVITGFPIQGGQQSDEVNAIGCENAQGFYSDRPIPAVEIGALVGARPIGH